MKQGFLSFTLVMTLGLCILVMRMQDEVDKIEQHTTELEEAVTTVEGVIAEVADPIVLDIVIKEAIPLDVHNYWEYKKLWDKKKEEMTSLGFKKWQVSQAGLKLRAEGEVGNVGTTGYTNPDICTLTIGKKSRPGWRQYMGTLMECAPLAELRKGDPVALNCVLDDIPGTFDPSTDDCKLEIL